MSPSTPASALPDRSSRSLRTLRASGSARVGTAILVIVGICALAPHLLAPVDPAEQRLLARFTPPLSRAADGTLAVLGTDQLGRDILSRLIYGARTSSLIGFSAVLLAGFTGTALGLLAGVRGGASDNAVMRLADMQLAFPFILLAITARWLPSSHRQRRAAGGGEHPALPERAAAGCGGGAAGAVTGRGAGRPLYPGVGRAATYFGRGGSCATGVPQRGQ